MTSLRTCIACTIVIAGMVAVAAGCAPTSAQTAVPSSTSSPGAVDAAGASGDGGALWDSSTVHSISIDYDADEYASMIEAYLADGDKEWISATVVIDGRRFEDVGLKLKGNSSLKGLSSEADAELSSQVPQDLPWIIRLDKFVDGQNLAGTTEIVARGNGSATSLNEALALELLDEAGLAAEQAIAVRLSIAGSDESLRLVIENPDDDWAARELGDGLLYKAEAGGDYSYRGKDASAYDEVFDQEAGEDDLTPLIDFLRWINESDDEEFEAELSEHLEVDAFATYLAFQEIVDNFDDIDGPGNNSYLSYDPDSGRMTVVTWDLNLAFGARPSGAGAGGGQRGAGASAGPERSQRLTGGQDADAAGAVAAPGGAPGGESNVLAERFLATNAFRALYESEIDRLTATLIDSGVAAQALQDWTEVLTAQAADLVSAETISQESAALAQQLG